jgi:hypothetical protein
VKRTTILIAAACAGVAIAANVMLTSCAMGPSAAPMVYRFPLARYFVQDSVGLVAGLRRVMGDIAWIQLLVYSGSPWESHVDELSDEEFADLKADRAKPHDHAHESEAEHREHITHITPGRYLNLLAHTQRVVRLDPAFGFAYFYGTGVLAWNLNRADEAQQLIDEGIEKLEYQKNNPKSDYWTLLLYRSAIVYKLGGKYNEMIGRMSQIVQDGKAPNMLKAILANLYLKNKDYRSSMAVWKLLLSSGDPEYVDRARDHVAALEDVLYRKDDAKLKELMLKPWEKTRR